MQIAVVTLFPEMFAALSDYGVSGRAIKQGIVSLDTWNPRDFTSDRHRTVDDRPYGGGPGMVMKVEPLRLAITEAKASLAGRLRENEDAGGTGIERPAKEQRKQIKTIYLSPQGRKLDQAGVATLAEQKGLILIAGRYEGIDERLIQSEVDEEWSLGDYVLSGGELPAMVMIDAIVRLLPGVLGHEQSAQQDSFSNGLLDCPHYTRPENLAGHPVPAVLLSGDHERIRRWRLKQSLGRTYERRPELIECLELDQEQQTLLKEYIDERFG